MTEKEYFQKLKQTYRIQNLTIRTEPHSPERLVDKVQQYVHQEKEPFTYVFFVVDVDETSKSQFEQAFSHARKTCSRKTEYAFVVSNICFETWLLAHYEDLRRGELSRKTLATKLVANGAVQETNVKHLSQNFPVEKHSKAVNFCNHAALNEVGKLNSSAMPALLERLGLSQESCTK